MKISLMASCLLFLAMSVTLFYATQASAITPSHPCLSPGTPVPTTTSTTIASTPHSLVINEILTHPGKQSYQCNSNNIYPWIELYNPQSQPVSFVQGDITYTDKTDSENLLITPTNPIAAHGFAVFFFDKVEKPGTLSDATTISLNIRGTIIDTLTLPTLTTDQSYARLPDGSNQWQISNYPTIGSSNSLIAPAQATKTARVKATPTTRLSPTAIAFPQQYATQDAGSTVTDQATPYAVTQSIWASFHFPAAAQKKATATPSQETAAAEPEHSSSTTTGDQQQQNIPRKSALSILLCLLFITIHRSYRLFFRT